MVHCPDCVGLNVFIANSRHGKVCALSFTFLGMRPAFKVDRYGVYRAPICAWQLELERSHITISIVENERTEERTLHSSNTSEWMESVGWFLSFPWHSGLKELVCKPARISSFTRYFVCSYCGRTMNIILSGTLSAAPVHHETMDYHISLLNLTFTWVSWGMFCT